ncbi:MAG: hypothetical protein E7648_06305 [Ruminococcaceae bacterium]|nr:hypothetical protein [Oscillospiraceae bacterium]
MAQNYYASWKNCATCAYWMGERTCSTFNQYATVPSSSEKGTCKIPKGPWRNCERSASSSCSSYEKWPILK